jgi:hypothetical protein
MPGHHAGLKAEGGELGLQMLKIREEELREQQHASELNLAAEELAFY